MATPVSDHIDKATEPARKRLRALATVIREEAPDAVERIAYGLATWHQGENLIHLGAFANHIGIYPGPAAIVAFAKELGAFKTSKGTIQVPHDMTLPTELVRQLTRWRVEQVAAKSGAKKSPAKSGAKKSAAKSGAAKPAAKKASATERPGKKTSVPAKPATKPATKK